MSPFVHLLIIGELLFTVASGRDDGACPAFVQFRPQPIGVEGLVAQQGFELKVPDQRLDANHVMTLTGQEYEADQVSQGICQGDDLGGQASS